MLDVSVPVAKSNVPPYIVSVGGRRVRRDKRPRNDWQVRPTHSRRAATAKAAPGKIVIGRGDKYMGNSVVWFVLGC